MKVRFCQRSSMKIKIEFDKDCPDFAQLAKREPNPRKRVRLIAMDQLKNRITLYRVAEALRINRHTVGIWYKNYKENGLEGLLDKPRSGKNPKLPREKNAEFIEKINLLQKEKSGGRIIGRDIREMLKREFNAEYAENSIYKVLRNLNISWITARSKHPKSNETIQEDFKKNFEKNIRSFAKRSKIGKC